MLAKIIVDIIRSRQSTETTCCSAAFHLVNPSIASWESLIPAIQTQYAVEPVNFHSWLKALEAFSNPTESDLQDKPALKIIDFYRGLGKRKAYLSSIIETTKAQAASQTMRNLGLIDAPLMENWLKQWGF